MVLLYYKYNIKKKKNFYKLLLYFICLNYKFLFFIYFNQFINIKKITNIDFKYLIISPYILNLFVLKSFKFLKKNLIIFCTNNLISLFKLFDTNNLLKNNINIISINYFFINVKFINQINIWFLLYDKNINIFIVFLYKFFILLQNLIKFYINN